MASANEPGQIEIVAIRTDGKTVPVWTGRSDGNVNAGKSPDGVLANLTVDKQLFVGYSGPILRGGDILRVDFTSDNTDGIDVSDCVIQVPFWEDGRAKTLNATDLGITTDLTPVANRRQAMGAGYTVPNNVQNGRFGNGSMVISIEDDTA